MLDPLGIRHDLWQRRLDLEVEGDPLFIDQRPQSLQRVRQQSRRINRQRGDHELSPIQTVHIEQIPYESIHLLGRLGDQLDALVRLRSVGLCSAKQRAAQHLDGRDRISEVVGHNTHHLVPRAQAGADGVVKPGVVERERGKPGEILGEPEVVAVEGTLCPKERQRPDQLLARHERQKKCGLRIHRFHRLQVGRVGARFQKPGCSVGLQQDR